MRLCVNRPNLHYFCLQNPFEYAFISIFSNAFSRNQSNTKEFPLDYETNMKVEQLSTLYTISFTSPRLDPDKDGDFCVYFALESNGSKMFVTDLALFVQALGQRLIKWSVLGHPDRLNPGNPAHPMLRDLAYCWDGIACAYGVLQFSASPVSVMNIRWIFHRTSWICGPFCHAHRYEYFSSGIFSDVERAMLPMVFTEMEAAAQYVQSNQFLPIFKSLICIPALGSFVMTAASLSMLQTARNISHIDIAYQFSFSYLKSPCIIICVTSQIRIVIPPHVP